MTEQNKSTWKCQSCGELINHNPRGTAAICIKCGGTSKLQPRSDEGLLTPEERREIPKGFHFLLEYKEELDCLLNLQLAKLNKLGWMSPDECQECQAQTECKIGELRNGLAELEKKLDDREADLIEAKREERERIDKLLAMVGIEIHSDHVLVIGYAEKHPGREQLEEWQALKGG